MDAIRHSDASLNELRKITESRERFRRLPKRATGLQRMFFALDSLIISPAEIHYCIEKLVDREEDTIVPKGNLGKKESIRSKMRWTAEPIPALAEIATLLKAAAADCTRVIDETDVGILVHLSQEYSRAEVQYSHLISTIIVWRMIAGRIAQYGSPSSKALIDLSDQLCGEVWTPYYSRVEKTVLKIVRESESASDIGVLVLLAELETNLPKNADHFPIEWAQQLYEQLSPILTIQADARLYWEQLMSKLSEAIRVGMAEWNWSQVAKAVKLTDFDTKTREILKKFGLRQKLNFLDPDREDAIVAYVLSGKEPMSWLGKDRHLLKIVMSTEVSGGSTQKRIFVPDRQLSEFLNEQDIRRFLITSEHRRINSIFHACEDLLTYCVPKKDRRDGVNTNHDFLDLLSYVRSQTSILHVKLALDLWLPVYFTGFATCSSERLIPMLPRLAKQIQCCPYVSA